MGERDGQQGRATANVDDPLAVKQQHASAAQQTTGVQADRMLASMLNQRATAPVDLQHDFGEAIVGSDNTVKQIHAPWNLGDTPALARFVVDGDGFELRSPEVVTLKPSAAMKGEDLAYVEHASPKIGFNPRKAGEARGTLKIAISWPLDGHVETQTINLRGSARSLNDAPEQRLGGEPVHDNSTQPAPVPARETKGAMKAPASIAITEKIREAAEAAARLGAQQLRGVDIAESEAAAYKKAIPKVERSIWWDLAEMALTIATGHIATAVAEKLLPRMLSKTVTEQIFTEKITSTVTPKIPIAVTQTIKQGLTSAGVLAIKGVVPQKDSKHPDEPLPERSHGRNSSNARIDFFEGQRELVDLAAAHYSNQVTDAIRYISPLLAQHPEQGEAALDAVASAFDESRADAKLKQADAIAPAWVSTVARMNLGGEETHTRNQAAGSAAVMDSTRKLDGAGHVRSANGVLDVYLRNDRIVGAKLNGVSQEVADRLADLPLAHAPVPIRFILGGENEPNPTIITRDDAGRVRVAGDMNGRSLEENNVKSATDLIERFLSVPFSKLNLEIVTDDGTGRGG